MVPDHTHVPTPQFLGIEGRMAVGCGRVGPDPGHRREREAVTEDRSLGIPGVVREPLCHEVGSCVAALGVFGSPPRLDQLS